MGNPTQPKGAYIYVVNPAPFPFNFHNNPGKDESSNPHPRYFQLSLLMPCNYAV